MTTKIKDFNKEDILNKLKELASKDFIEQDLQLQSISAEHKIAKGVLQKQLDKIISENRNKEAKDKNVTIEDLGMKIGQAIDKKYIAEQIINMHPIYYDKGRNWWLWNFKLYKWEIVDETDILNAIDKQSTVNTVNSKERNEILEALKQVSRLDAPAPIKPTWIQFRDEIFDIETGERFKATRYWFVTNPLPWKLDKDNHELTPNMDRIFEEWVGKEEVKKLYEILAYCMMPDYPLHRIFCFIGSGMNGKSKYLELLRKFIGLDNCCSTELDTLIASRFEVTRLHKKLVCQMGETNFSEMSRTSMLKKLSGGDLIGFEYKGKDHFEDVCYSKLLIATNNLPTTNDKTIGFYRRWMIIDFPNEFSEAKDILAEIPDEEYECLALKCCAILKDLLKTRKFTNEGSITDRTRKYEEKSNFLANFIEIATEKEPNSHITSADFYKKFISWSKENRHRELSETSVGIGLKKLGIEQERKYFNWLYDGKGGQLKCWIGIKWK